MSLNPPRQPSGPAASPARQDAESLLLEAVRQRRRQESLERVQRCVHRRGLEWLHQFQSLTLPALEGSEAAAWLEALIADGLGQSAPADASRPEELRGEHPAQDSQALVASIDPPGDNPQQAAIAQRATAAVDGAIASMLAEFPELAPSTPSLTFVLPLTAAPPAPAVPEVLPARPAPVVFSLAAERVLEPLALSGPQPETPPEEITDPGDTVGSEGSGNEVLSDHELSDAAACVGDPGPFDGTSLDAAAPWQRSAAEFGSALGSRLLSRLSRIGLRSLARVRPDRDGEPDETNPAVALVAPQWEPSIPQERPEPLPTPMNAEAADSFPLDQADRVIGSPAPGPDPLAVALRLAERQRGPEADPRQDAAPAPAALADLRAWLPDSSLPRAS